MIFSTLNNEIFYRSILFPAISGYFHNFLLPNLTQKFTRNTAQRFESFDCGEVGPEVNERT
jgi:hypothetical protein